jgi:hypothetical protein
MQHVPALLIRLKLPGVHGHAVLPHSDTQCATPESPLTNRCFERNTCTRKSDEKSAKYAKKSSKTQNKRQKNILVTRERAEKRTEVDLSTRGQTSRDDSVVPQGDRSKGCDEERFGANN